VQAGAVATKGVLGDACAASYRERSGMAYGGARVPEFIRAGEEGVVRGKIDVKRGVKYPLTQKKAGSVSAGFSLSSFPELRSDGAADPLPRKRRSHLYDSTEAGIWHRLKRLLRKDNVLSFFFVFF